MDPGGAGAGPVPARGCDGIRRPSPGEPPACRAITVGGWHALATVTAVPGGPVSATEVRTRDHDCGLYKSRARGDHHQSQVESGSSVREIIIVSMTRIPAGVAKSLANRLRRSVAAGRRGGLGPGTAGAMRNRLRLRVGVMSHGLAH